MAQDRVEAVERALTILNCFNQEQKELSLKQLAEKTGFYKSTILRLAGSLERYGYLLRRDDGIYRLGTTLIGLGETARRSFDVSTIVRPVIENLRDLFNESVAFYTRSGEQRICLYRANANRAIRHQLEEGRRLPLDRGAAGRVFLAYSGQAGPPYELIRKQGWCVSVGERDPEVSAIAVPVLNTKGDIIAVLSMSGLVSHFNEDRQPEFIKTLQGKAGELAEQLAMTPLPEFDTRVKSISGPE